MPNSRREQRESGLTEGRPPRHLALPQTLTVAVAEAVVLGDADGPEVEP